jgi:hypothetical protein
MKSSQTRPGRVFVIRLEHGDIIHECLERFAALDMKPRSNDWARCWHPHAAATETLVTAGADAG